MSEERVYTLMREIEAREKQLTKIAALVGRAGGLIDIDSTPTSGQVRGAQTALAEAISLITGVKPE